MRFITLSIFILLCHCMFSQWISLKPMPTARQEMPAALVNRKIYIIGGITTNLLEGFVTKRNEAYDINTNTWNVLKNLPVARHHHAVAVLGDKIYVIGGYDNVAFNPVNTVFVYNTQNDSWSQKQNLPVKSGAGDAVAFNNKIYFFGGSNKQQTLDSAFMYDPNTNTWMAIQSMPTAREHIAAALIDSLIYITAGRGSADADKLLQIYNPATDTWYTGADITTPRSGSDAVSYNHRFYVLGGEGDRAFNEFEEYNPMANTWDSFPVMRHARHGLGCVVVNDTLYAIGGATIPGFAPCAYNEAFVFRSLPTPVNYYRSEKVEVFWTNDHEFNFKISSNEESGNLSIFSGDGKIIFYKRIRIHQPVQTDTKTWSTGIYFLSLEINDKIYSGKLFYVK